MDIALKLKRAVATVAAGAIFASTAGIAIAQTFNDVSPDAWYYDYVEGLVDDGVVDAADNYRPADALNRAELTKMAIVAIDGLAGYEAPATPTFDDVPADAWFFDYVEAAVQLGIVNGYTDAQGNPTGLFGPGDTTNRAASTKILVNAFSVPTDLDPSSMFPDVQEADWFHDYVVTAYNQSVLDGYADGTFKPANSINRAEIAKLINTAQNPMERDEEGEEGEEGEEPVPSSDGDLEVSLNDNSPASSTLPLGANGVALATYDFTADSDDVQVTQLVITRGGVGQSEDWENLYIYHGANRLTTGRTINNDTNTATFPLKDVMVDAGTTTSLTLVGDVENPAGASNQHYFYLASAADVSSNAQSTAGDFPVAGNTFTMGGATTIVNSVTVTKGTAPTKITVGEQDAEVASLKLKAGSENDIALHQLALTNGGALSSDKMVNCRLLRGTDEVATSEGFMGDILTFVLDSPYIIDEGQNKTFYVNCDIDGGRSTDTAQLYVDEQTDVVAIDQQYGFGAEVTNNLIQNQTGCNASGEIGAGGLPCSNVVQLEGGDVTVVDNGPASEQLAQNSTNNELLNFSLTAVRDLTVRDTFIQIDIQNAAGTGPTIGTLGTEAEDGGQVSTNTTLEVASTTDFEVGDMVQVATANGTEYGIVTVVTVNDSLTVTGIVGVPTNAATINEVNPYDFLKNVRLVDLDSGSTLAGPMTDANSGATLIAGPPASYSKTHSEDYDLFGGETRHLSVQADLDQDFPSGYQIRAQVQYNGTIKDLDANEFIPASNVIGAGTTALAGNFHTSAANSLSVALASTPTSTNFVKGDANAAVLGLSMTAGDAGDILVKRLDLRAYADTATGAAFSATGDTAANTVVSTVTLYDGNDIVAGPESLDLVDTGAAGFTADTDYYRAQFDDLNMNVPAGQTETLVAKVNLLTTISATRYLALDVVPGTDIIAEDDDNNTITPSGAAVNGASPHTVEMTVDVSGSLSAFGDSNPDEDILVAGSQEQHVGNFRFKALDEDFEVQTLTIVNDLAGDFGDAAVNSSAISQVVIKYPDVNGVTQTKTSSLSGGTAKFSNLDFYAPADEDVFLEVFVNVNTVAAGTQSISGKTIRLGIQNTGNDITTFKAVGQSSSEQENFDDANPSARVDLSDSPDVFVVRRTVPSIANVSASTSLGSGEQTLMSFSVTADSAGAVTLGRLVFEITKDDDAGGDLDLDEFKFFRGATLVTDANIFEGGASVGVGGATVGAGSATHTVIVSFNSQEGVNAGSTQTYSLKATVVSADANDDSVQTKIAVGDESTAVAGILGTSVCGAGNTTLCSTGNGNTGRIYDTAANEGLFVASATEFADTATAARNIIWSDRSADTYSYPTVAAGTVTQATGSFDYTNGYLLDVTNLTPHTLD